MTQSNGKTADLAEDYRTLSPHNQELIRHFIRNKQLKGVRQSTIAIELFIVNSLIRFFGDVPLDELTTEQLEDWYLWFRDTPSHLNGKKRSVTTVKNSVAYLRQFMISIHGEDKVALMFKRIKPARNRNLVVKEEELLSDDEIYRMMSLCTWERDRALIAVLASSGCRIGELCNLKIRDVTLTREKASLHLNGKTGPRDVDIYDGVPELKRWMQVHPCRDDPDAPLFINKNKRGSEYAPIHETGVNKMLGRLAEKAGVPENKRHNPHSFRHKRATDLADHLTTADLRVMFGWADMSNTPSIYVHSSRAKVNKKLAELAGVKIPQEQSMHKMVKYCPVCGAANSINDKWCNFCFSVLDEEQAKVDARIEQFMMKRMREKQESKK
ncbi:MAG TPA: tyrosine-type recombinase/integrase [Methanocorpusculum sp.]|nr:tyrosine-type recombinase/integrase [Methanocorpusculum sp.]